MRITPERRAGKFFNPDAFNPTIIGLSPLGNNSVEAQTSPADVPVTNTTPREVPLVYDSVTGTYCSPLDRTNQEERLEGIEIARISNDDQEFLSKAGFLVGFVTNTPVGIPSVGNIMQDQNGNAMYDQNGNPMLDDSGFSGNLSGS